MTILSILDELAATSSRNEKIAILQANKDNDLLRQIIHAALHPRINYYIRKIPSYAPRLDSEISDLHWALAELRALSARRVTGNAAIELLATILEHLSPEDAEVIKRVIAKDLKCGVSEGTVNKVWSKLIPDNFVMLCSAFDTKLVDKLFSTAQVYIQRKLDGSRINIIRTGLGIEAITRNGNPVELAESVTAELLKLPAGFVFDGECLFVDEMGKYADRKTSNGLFTKAIRGTATEDELARMRFVFWDIIKLDEFEAGKGTIEYLQRLDQLTFLVGRIKSDMFTCVHTDEVATLDEAVEIYNRERANGEEGIILKDPKHVFEAKRSKHLVKMKAEESIDVLVTGWEEGTGKNVGRLGALRISTADGKIQCNVGTGFTDKDRDELTEEFIVGKIVELCYNDIIPDKRTGQLSFFLPVFKSVRLDKSEADNSPK